MQWTLLMDAAVLAARVTFILFLVARAAAAQLMFN
jgi:hypothetical protein